MSQDVGRSFLTPVTDEHAVHIVGSSAIPPRYSPAKQSALVAALSSRVAASDEVSVAAAEALARALVELSAAWKVATDQGGPTRPLMPPAGKWRRLALSRDIAIEQEHREGYNTSSGMVGAEPYGLVTTYRGEKVHAVTTTWTFQQSVCALLDWSPRKIVRAIRRIESRTFWCRKVGAAREAQELDRQSGARAWAEELVARATATRIAGAAAPAPPGRLEVHYGLAHLYERTLLRR